ncbi:MAG: type II toxin-antitoxin system RelE/ParE family toxin [Bacteroidales bacterium]|nr:type II toxin-antitoxin system RelE/ParE family toxin [Bacteroidales bacterium]MBQ1732928.1 type II toxin-antitoxin system RelE/ParE family toxin [Bacteroidales bacterium]MBQ2575190.1 type II toxin-antitoxin system RelE/ParE family toxin [Bacteroidales bacterium]
MTYKIHWLQRAAKDFDDIYLYYKQVAGDSVAQRRMSKILQATSNLKYLPNIGPIDGDFQHIPSYRYLVVMDYRIYYFTEGQTIYIAAIWDCRQGGKVFNHK